MFAPINSIYPSADFAAILYWFW